jgi:hypothetical protein
LTDASITVLNPRSESAAVDAMARFYRSFYQGSHERFFVFGINPGRFGGGITGIPFTDPVALRDACAIETSFTMQRELSSAFIWEFIEAFGGIRSFAESLYLTAVCPFGFVRDGKNLNYYDDPHLQRSVTGYITETMERQLHIGARRDAAIILGRGKNARFVEKLNTANGWFDAIHVLDHPRYIMQYQRRALEQHVNEYVRVCRALTRL